jgi:hypothetical protein
MPKSSGLARKLEDSIRLPNTSDENHKGIQQDERPTDWHVRGSGKARHGISAR